MDTTTIKVDRLYQAAFESGVLLVCGACLKAASRVSAFIPESVCWPGMKETNCDICGEWASAIMKTDVNKGLRLLEARKALGDWMHENTAHPRYEAANQKLYFIDEELRNQYRL